MASIRKLLARPDGETALSNAVAYYKNPANRGKPVGTSSTNRPATVEAYLKPFVYNADSKLYLKVRVNSAARTSYATPLGGHLYLTVPTGGVNVGRITGARPAKIVIVNSSKTGTYTAAKATKTNYLKYQTETVSLPFGRGATDTESMQEAFQDIKGKIPAASAESNRRIYLQPEKIAAL